MRHQPINSMKEITMEDLDRRLRRMETRLVKLMLHLGMNPYSPEEQPEQYEQWQRSTQSKQSR